MKTKLQFCGVLLRRWSWKEHSSVTLGKPLHIYCSGLPRNKALSWWQRKSFYTFTVKVSQVTELHVSGRLLSRWSWKGHSSVSMRKTTGSLLRSPGTQSFELVEFFLEDGLWKGIHLWHGGSLCMFIQVFWETELIELVEFYLEDSLQKAIHEWHRRSHCTLVQVSQETHHLPGDRAVWVSRVVLWRLPWKSH